MRCPDCRSQLTIGSTFCDCGWRAVGGGEKIPVFKPCHFNSDGKCRYDHDKNNRSSPPKGATVRINDYWICNYHYEHGYDRILRNGQEMSLAEMKINGRLFGGKKADAERKAIQEEA